MEIIFINNNLLDRFRNSTILDELPAKADIHLSLKE